MPLQSSTHHALKFTFESSFEMHGHQQALIYQVQVQPSSCYSKNIH
jgi:hypothetical protein